MHGLVQSLRRLRTGVPRRGGAGGAAREGFGEVAQRHGVGVLAAGLGGVGQFAGDHAVLHAFDDRFDEGRAGEDDAHVHVDLGGDGGGEERGRGDARLAVGGHEVDEAEDDERDRPDAGVSCRLSVGSRMARRTGCGGRRRR